MGKGKNNESRSLALHQSMGIYNPIKQFFDGLSIDAYNS